MPFLKRNKTVILLLAVQLVCLGVVGTKVTWSNILLFSFLGIATGLELGRNYLEDMRDHQVRWFNERIHFLHEEIGRMKRAAWPVKWSLMESAPKDGTRIIVRCYNISQPRIVFYQVDNDQHAPGWRLADPDSPYLTDEIPIGWVPLPAV